MRQKFNHNGGEWLRPDIPSATPQQWKCHICSKDIGNEEEQYRTSTNIEQVRFISESRYWHETNVNVVFCSPECSVIYHFPKNKASTTDKDNP